MGDATTTLTDAAVHPILLSRRVKADNPNKAVLLPLYKLDWSIVALETQPIFLAFGAIVHNKPNVKLTGLRGF